MAIFPSSAIPAAAAGGFDIDNSLRFNDDDSANLTWTPSGSGSSTLLSFSCWVKRSSFGAGGAGSAQDKIFATTGGNEGLFFTQTDTIKYATTSGSFESTAVFRDPSAWYHIVLSVNTGGTSYIYVNNTQVASGSVTGMVEINTAVVHFIGAEAGPSRFLDGYLAEVHFIDGTALTPSSFGEEDTDYKHWKPKEVTGLTYGTNGFYLDFSNTGDKHTLSAVGNANHSTAQYKIGSSSIAFDGTGDYLSFPDSNDWNFGTNDFTIEAWVYLNSTGSHGMFAQGASEATKFEWFLGNDQTCKVKGAIDIEIGGTQFSTGVWTHVALVRDGSTFRYFQDGVADGTATSSTSIPNSSGSAYIGIRRDLADSYAFDGYIDEYRISNTARYTSGFTPSTTAFTEDANTLLLIHSDTTNGSTTFTDSSGAVGGLGNDAAGTNNWTANNLASTDQMVDSPTNNFCTWNPITATETNGIYSEGNLKVTSGSTQTATERGTISFSSGKWYWEYTTTGSSIDAQYLGIAVPDISVLAQSAGTVQFYTSASTGRIYNGGTIVSTVSPYAVTDIIGIAVDMDGGSIKWYKNNSLVYTQSTLDDSEYVPLGRVHSNSSSLYANFGQDSSFAGTNTTTAGPYTDGGGIGDFFYQPPPGFLALCTKNLPEPAVIPSEHFNVKTYTGTGTTNNITGIGFQPDLVWSKSRSNDDNNSLFDSVRGATKAIFSNGSTEELTISTGLTSFDSDGYTLGSRDWINNSGWTFVSWNWKAGTSASGTTSGSGTLKSYTASYNADAGFSIIKYEGNGTSNHKIPHHLGVAPDLVIVKNRDIDINWVVGHSSTGWGKRINLNNTSAHVVADTWNYVDPTTTLVNLGGGDTHQNGNGANDIMYCFASKEGYSKMGSYIGNGSSTDGTFVYCGFQPKYVLIRRTDVAKSWYIHDTARSTYNEIYGGRLLADSSAAEASAPGFEGDYLSNGFKHYNGDSGFNANGGNYIFIAFAEYPFKYSTAR